MTKEQIIEEAKQRGIVPGARINCAYGSGVGTVAPYSEWRCMFGSWWCGTDDDGCSLRAWDYGRWAKVVSPAPAQPEGLVDGMACEPDEHMRAAIVAKSVEVGSSSGKYPIWGKYFYWDAREHKLLQGDSAMSKPIPTGEFYDRLCRMPKVEPPIMIGSDKVEFLKGSIRVGCATIDNATVRLITSKLND